MSPFAVTSLMFWVYTKIEYLSCIHEVMSVIKGFVATFPFTVTVYAEETGRVSCVRKAKCVCGLMFGNGCSN